MRANILPCAPNQFSYDAENHQKEMKDSGNSTLGTYQYDGEGRRVKKVAGSETTIFVYDGGADDRVRHAILRFYG